MGLDCQPAPETAIPTTVELDVSTATAHPELGVDYVPGVLAVYATDGHDAAALTALFLGEGGAVVAYRQTTRRYLVQFPSETTYEQMTTARDAISASPDVGLVDEIWLDAPSNPPDDAGWGALADWNDLEPAGNEYYLEMIHALSAWNRTNGPSDAPVKLGVIDWGRPDNADLSLRQVTYLTGPESQASYQSGHGTASAGVAAAKGDNARGLTGVVWNADIYYCETDGTDDRLFFCMGWLVDRGVKVINYSGGRGYREKGTSCGSFGYPWDCAFAGGTAPEDDTSAARSLSSFTIPRWQRELGALALPDRPWVLVQSAGNEALTEARFSALSLWVATEPSTPDELSQRLLVVGAVDSAGRLAAYSNRGALHLVAPGGDGVEGGTDMLVLANGGGTTRKAGTSFAAPLVSGALALAWSISPNLSPASMTNAVLSGSTERHLDDRALRHQRLGVGLRVDPPARRRRHQPLAGARRRDRALRADL